MSTCGSSDRSHASSDLGITRPGGAEDGEPAVDPQPLVERPSAVSSPPGMPMVTRSGCTRQGSSHGGGDHGARDRIDGRLARGDLQTGPGDGADARAGDELERRLAGGRPAGAPSTTSTSTTTVMPSVTSGSSPASLITAARAQPRRGRSTDSTASVTRSPSGSSTSTASTRLAGQRPRRGRRGGRGTRPGRETGAQLLVSLRHALSLGHAQQRVDGGGRERAPAARALDGDEGQVRLDERRLGLGRVDEPDRHADHQRRPRHTLGGQRQHLAQRRRRVAESDHGSRPGAHRTSAWRRPPACDRCSWTPPRSPRPR